MSILKKCTVPVLVAAAATTALIAPAAAASAAEYPAYACSRLIALDGGPVGRWGGEGCSVAVGYLPGRGPVYGPFIIANPYTGHRVFCDPVSPYSGRADLPYRVEGFYCHPIGDA